MVGVRAVYFSGLCVAVTISFLERGDSDSSQEALVTDIKDLSQSGGLRNGEDGMIRTT